jgi:hypothetical protein
LPVFLNGVIAQCKKRPQILNLVFASLPKQLDQTLQGLLIRLKVAYQGTAITVSFEE